MKLIVNIADGKISKNLEDELVTYSLGSCIGVAVYDRVAKIGGLLHFQLPTARQGVRQSQSPFMYADTGMKLLLEQMVALGGNVKRMQVKIAGGAAMLNDSKTFAIGKRNHAAIRQVLWKNGLFIEKEDVGGESPRNMQLKIEDGSVSIKTQGQLIAL